MKPPRKYRTEGKPPAPASARSAAARVSENARAPLERPATSLLPRWALLGPLLLFVAGAVFGMLEVHSSTDTWIGLAAGRQIVQQTSLLNLRQTFPKVDTFSFTFEGQVFFNQNWLTHVYFWVLYDWFGRSAVIIGTWALCAGIFTFVLLATRVRSGSWITAALAASLVAVATRDWVSARPATMQFFCLAALWFLLSVLLKNRPVSEPARGAGRSESAEGLTNDGRAETPHRMRVDRRWWAIAALLPLFLVWGNAHGSFIFGYGLVGLFLGCWLAARTFEWVRGRGGLTTLTDLQAVAVGGAAFAAALLTVALGPFGLDNFTHQLKVAKSDVFRQVGEWHPPDRPAHPPERAGHLRLSERIPIIVRILLTGQLGRDTVFPPVERFWWALRALLGCFLVAGLLRLASWVCGARPGEPPQVARRYPLQTLLMDAAAVAIGVHMAFFARRFAPMLYILATPALAVWLLLLCRRMSGWLRMRVRDVLVVAAWPAALATGFSTWNQARADLIETFRGRSGYDLLARVTRLDGSSREVLDFLARNALRVKLLTEWTQAGVVMFHVPTARVFMDGRAQQVYNEEHYRLYSDVWWHGPTEGPRALDRLTEMGTDTVLLRLHQHDVMRRTLEQSGRWLPVLTGDGAWQIYMRIDSEPMREVIHRERDRRLWWPQSARGHYSRGRLLLLLSPLNVDRAIDHLKRACEQEIQMGLEAYPMITAALVRAKRPQEAEAYLLREAQRIQGAAELDSGLRELLARTVRECLSAARRQSGVASPQEGG